MIDFGKTVVERRRKRWKCAERSRSWRVLRPEAEGALIKRAKGPESDVFVASTWDQGWVS